jgi:imidazolonepropionase-like amidohydrolase
MAAAALLGQPLQAQEGYPVNGVQDTRPQRYAFTNATVVQDYQTKLEGATLLIEGGKVVAVGKDLKLPAGTIVQDLKGRWIYPGFVELYAEYGLPKLERSRRNRFDPPQTETTTPGAYSWNQAIRAEFDAVSQFVPNAEEARAWRNQGFSVLLTHRQDGIARGTGALVSLAEDKTQNVILLPQASGHLSFSKGSSNQEYPGSLMGAISLLRQTYLDAAWYQSQKDKPFTDRSLGAFQQQRSLPQIFEASNMLSVLRADKIGDEFGLQYIIRGAGDEYQRLDAIKATGASLIVPLNFPEAYDLSDPLDELNVPLSDMKHWEMAPYNPMLLQQKGIAFALTTDGLKDKTTFWKNLRKAVAHGLDKQEALKALTHTPARLINAQDKVGALRPGMMANFLIASGDVLDEEATLYENWIGGKRYQLQAMPAQELAGRYTLALGQNQYTIDITGVAGKEKFRLLQSDTTGTDLKASVSENLISFTFNPNPKDTVNARLLRLSGWWDGRNWKGLGRNEQGQELPFTMTYTGPAKEKKKEDKKPKEALPKPSDVPTPFLAYGHTQPLQPQRYLIKGATVWTNEQEGIIEGADVLVEGGKIRQIGKNLSASGAQVIDGTGKHLTSGIIDEHSHIAIQGGVNEGTQSVTAEVRISDVVNSEDINIYRQLAGGVTAAQLLHGSANPIGGQSALIKLRWGKSPEELKITGADGYIKFALGENVKQANWGPHYTERFPQSRMGVEQVMVDAFTRARAYEQSWKTYNGLSKKQKAGALAPRRDLELETLVDILNDKVYITSHSYVQSEINMLMKVADQFGFRVNTFTHILEGYKVADKMAKHGAGGSTFADWWVYKMEVQEAIPYNAALMHGQGVVTAINSDDAEMARRLNQEAAKTVKYGGMSEEEAWKMVTLNPAKLLHLDGQMGSIKAGKDADLVLWNENPLSIYARPLKTMIDGIVYYDLEQDEKMRREVQQERARLILKMQDAGKNGEATKPVAVKSQYIWHCEDRNGFNHQEAELHEGH